MAVFRALKGDAPFDADPRPDSGERPHAEDEDVIRPARVTHRIVLAEVFP
jgi:hypothetical protein